MTEVITMVISSLALILSSLTVGFSIMSYCKVVGMEKSTHKVQYVPMNHEEIPDSIIEEDKDEPKLTTMNGGADKKLMEEFKEHMYPDITDEHI